MDHSNSAGSNSYSTQAAKPRDPDLKQRARQLRDTLGDLDGAVRELRVQVFGCLPPSADHHEKCDVQDSLEAIVTDAATRAAMVLGEVRTLLDRLGE